MSVLSRDALEASPLADLHAIASELGIDGFRRLRKPDLVEAIVDRAGAGAADGDGAAAADGDGAAPAAVAEEEKPKRRTRGGRTRARKPAEDDAEATTAETATATADDEAVEEPVVDEPAVEEPVVEEPVAEDGPAEEPVAEEQEDEGREGRERRRGGRRPRAEEAADGEPVVEGVVELAGNGAAFLRLEDQPDVYVSAAQVRRCELVDGDRVSGPMRRPRRSERYPSLVRVDTINGASADEVAAGTPFDELPAAWPDERLALGGDDPTLKAIEWLTPIGRGSRVTIAGPARSGKSEALRRLSGALAGQDGLEVAVVLLGVRPEEAHEWRHGAEDGGPAASAALTLAASADTQGQALERAVETARRVAARGGHAVLLVDTLDHVHPSTARRALTAARNIPDGGSLTIVATASAPLGGETTVIALDYALASTGRFPALDLPASGTLRPELLVGEPGAEEITRTRLQAIEERKAAAAPARKTAQRRK